MNWRRGLFRLWIVGAALFVFAIAFVSYSDIKEQFDVASEPEVTSSFIAEFRQRYPEFNNLTDDQLSDAVYRNSTATCHGSNLKRRFLKRSLHQKRS